jgi:hypothetical protein
MHFSQSPFYADALEIFVVLKSKWSEVLELPLSLLRRFAVGYYRQCPFVEDKLVTSAINSLVENEAGYSTIRIGKYESMLHN